MICNYCREEKDKEEFVKQTRSKTGYTNMCKQCKRKYNDAYKLRPKKNKDEKIEKPKEKEKPKSKTFNTINNGVEILIVDKKEFSLLHQKFKKNCSRIEKKDFDGKYGTVVMYYNSKGINDLKIITGRVNI